MWMCVMEMDGGWLSLTVEQKDSSLNACLPASISLPLTAPPPNTQFHLSIALLRCVCVSIFQKTFISQKKQTEPSCLSGADRRRSNLGVLGAFFRRH